MYLDGSPTNQTITTEFTILKENSTAAEPADNKGNYKQTTSTTSSEKASIKPDAE